MRYTHAALSTKVLAVNHAATFCNHLAPKMKAKLAAIPHVDLLKTDNSLRASTKKLLDETIPAGTPDTFSVSYDAGALGYWIRVKIRVRLDTGNGSCQYGEATAFLADLTGGSVSRIHESYEQKADWTAEEVRQKATEAEEAQTRARNLANGLHAFDLGLRVW